MQGGSAHRRRQDRAPAEDAISEARASEFLKVPVDDLNHESEWMLS